MVAKFLGSLFGGGAEPRSAAVTGAESPDAVDPAGDELTATAAALKHLRGTVLTNGAQLPPLVASQVLRLADILHALIGYIGRSGASTEQRVLLNAVITDYLPSPLRAYLSLASESRSDGSAETKVLLKQLDTLYSTVNNLDNQVRTGAITELAVHGQFLRDKFDVDGLHLEGR
jgi:signal transduction histidine kinase